MRVGRKKKIMIKAREARPAAAVNVMVELFLQARPPKGPDRFRRCTIAFGQLNKRVL